MPRFMIHAFPKRMWYVERFLVPSLLEQGCPPEDVEIWNDTEKKGNLRSCMDSFAARPGDGGTWHIQDDVLLCRDFYKRCKEHDEGVVFGFCSPKFTDDPQQKGRVHQPDSWHSFQCVRIPDVYARECAEWFDTYALNEPMYQIWAKTGKMDDSFFRAFMEQRHPGDLILNLAPNLVDHVDWLVGGSAINEWRGYVVRAHYWEDEDLLEELKQKLEEDA